MSSNTADFFASSLRLTFQMAATVLGQFNGDNAPLYGQAAADAFDYLRARAAL
jgi:hypothetical protein